MNLAFALLLDMTVKASLLCLAAFALSGLARRRSAELRHDLWMAAIACCACLPIVAAATRLVGPDLATAPVHEAVMAVTPSLPSAAPTGAIEIVDRIWSGDGGAPVVGRMAALFVLLWLAGIAVAVLRAVTDYGGAAAVVRRARPFPGVSSPAGVPLLISAELPAPAVFGFRRPAILLPAEAVAWPAERLRAVLAHEMAHVERRDCALELVGRLAGALNWFNPLVLRGLRRLRVERELACDARVVATDIDPHHYAAALVEVARRAVGARQRAMVAMARAPELERRVVLLLGPRRKPDRRSPLRPVLVSAGVALILGFAAVTAPAAGVLGSGSVQPGDWPMRGLDDPVSERLPFPYAEAADVAAAVPAEGAEAAAIGMLQTQLDRESRGYGDLVRERAIWALAQVQDGRLFEPVAARIADGDWRVRAYAAWALAATGDARATPRLLTMLDDPVWRVRAMAAGGLANLADPRAAEGLAAAARDPAWQVRISALQYVERRRDAALARRLRPLLDDPHNGTRLLAQSVLDRF
jgi:beta-lactamase regulating signal transducer with metallopeptidase domain